MIILRSLLFVIVALVAASYGTASAGSITSCTISNNTTHEVLAQDSGETSCSAYFETEFPLISQASWYQTGALAFGATAWATAQFDCCDFSARVDSVAEGWTREDFYFADAPIGSILRIDWVLSSIGVDPEVRLFLFAGQELSHPIGIQRTEFPVVDGEPVAVETYLRQNCYSSSYCKGETRFLLMGIDLVDASGVSQTGYRYGLGSGLSLRVNDSSRPLFPGGVLDQSLPEPSTFLLTGGTLIIAALTRIRRR